MEEKKCFSGLVIISLIFIFLFCLAFSGKKNMVEDEVFSYGSSNHEGYPLMQIEDGTSYHQGATPFEDYVYVKAEGRFRYGNVWRNQSIDTHPPLYYVCLHTVCSLFPNSFSLWYAGIVNLIFSTGTIWVLFFLVRELGYSSNISLAMCLIYTFTAGIYQDNTLLRMYVMAMFFCTLLSFLHIKYFNCGLKNSVSIWIACAAVLFVLTHYYAIIFIVCQAFVTGIVILRQKKYTELVRYVLSLCGAAILSVALFPAMIEHIFKRYRGLEAFANISKSDDVISRLRFFAGEINRDVWGGGGVAVVCSLLFLVVMICVKRDEQRRQLLLRLLLMLIPAVVYFLIVSKIVPYESNRYMTPIHGILLVSGYLFILLASADIKPYKLRKLIYSAIVFLMLYYGIRTCPWQFSFQGASSEKALEIAREACNIPCMYIYKEGTEWAVQRSYFEIKEYRNLVFYEEQNVDYRESIFSEDTGEMMVYIEKECDVDKALSSLKKQFPKLKSTEAISEEGYTFVYHLSE